MSSRSLRRPLLLRQGGRQIRTAGLIAGAAAFAAAEIACALTVGGLAESGRAEAVSFFACRPWLLLAAAALATRLGWRERLAFYAFALAAAGASESILLFWVGADEPWIEAIRGFAAGAVLLVPIDVVLQAARHWFGARGVAAGALILAVALSVPATLRPYQRLLEKPAAPHAGYGKPNLLLMTALPIVWGESGAFDPGSRPALSFKALQEEYAIRPVDLLDDRNLGDARLLLLAQPRWLAPAELVAVDRWVRAGGRALILADPRLVWPSELPLGDIRRPPPASLLGPLLDHWGVEVQAAEAGPVATSFGKRRLAMEAPGRIRIAGSGCSLRRPWLAACRIGQGRVLILADADLMRDDLWAAPGPGGDGRDRRLADNPLILADLLDGLAGRDRIRVREKARWRGPNARLDHALLLSLAPLLLIAIGGVILRRRGCTCLSTGLSNVNIERTD